MNSIVPFDGSIGKRESRALSRELSQLRAYGSFQLAVIDQQAALNAARADAAAEVAGVAMDSIARVTLRAEQLTQMVPSGRGRYNAIADALTIAQIGIVQDTARRR